MSKKAYSPEERRQVRRRLIEGALRLFARYGYQKTTLAKLCEAAGISRTFFYTFFPGKEALMMEALYIQQPRLVALAKKLMAGSPDWKTAMEQFLHFCSEGEKYDILILSLEEQQEIYRYCSEDSLREFRKRQLAFFLEILRIFTVHASRKEAALIGSLFLSAILIRKAIPGSAPFLPEETADAMTQFQLHSLLGLIETIRNTHIHEESVPSDSSS